MSRRPRILLTHALDADAEGRLGAHADVVRIPDDRVETIHSALTDCDALVCRTHVRVDAALLAAAPQLRVVGVAGVGLDRVDVAACEAAGVRVVNTPAAASAAVAELTIGLMLQLLRPIPRLMNAYQQGDYRGARAQPHGDELGSLTVGVLGFGRIGRRVGQAAALGLGARVLFHDLVMIDDPPAGCQAVDRATLLAEADFLSLHVPLTVATRGMFEAQLLADCKRGLRLINTARGEVVVTDALVAALDSGQLGGAGLDVTEPEPLPGDHPLFGRDNVILTPHIAARTHGGLRRMFGVVDRVLAALAELADFVVDLPPADPGEEGQRHDQ